MKKEIIKILNQIYNNEEINLSVLNENDSDLKEILSKIDEKYKTLHLLNTASDLEDIMDNVPIGICITNKFGHFEYVNPAYCRLYGYNRTELIGKHFSIVVPEENRAELNKLHDDFMGRTYELQGEWTVKNKKNELITIIANASYLENLKGEPKKITYVLDITDKKRTVAELQETVSRLAEESKSMKQFQESRNRVERMIRHDIKNPVNGILGFTNILLEQESDSEKIEILGYVKESAEKIQEIIEQSSDLIKMEEGTYRPSFKRINLIEIFSKIETELRTIFKTKSLNFNFLFNKTELGEDESFYIFGKRLHIENLFANLIKNAAEASPFNRAIKLNITKDKADVIVKIHNEGAVPKSIRDNFFEKYSTYGKKDGTGLGTYIAKLITENHNGSISLKTDEEFGTEVEVRLPNNFIKN